ncbi:MAG: dihydroorotate dehydrogenase, partial [Thermoproteota archaeon]
FTLDPELVHDSTIMMANQFKNILLKSLPALNIPESNRYLASSQNIKWNFPIGLAAGLDKNAMALEYFSQVGFGSVEFGTVTPISQGGNPKPRIWRYPKLKSLRNAMGFPNAGLESIAKRVLEYSGNACLGANIGKNKNSDGEKIFEDYAVLFKNFCQTSDYIAINVSSPNTPGLRNLQGPEFLQKILDALKSDREKHPIPVYIKIAPDLLENEIKDIIQIAAKNNLAGIIATNTTVAHDFGKGGLSGNYLKDHAKLVRSWLLKHSNEIPNFDIIGVGGIDSFEDCKIFWKAGGQFLQIYTGFIYQGPQLLIDLKNKLDQEFNIHQVSGFSEYLTYLRSQ